MKPITEFCKFIKDNEYNILTVDQAKQHINSEYIILNVAKYMYTFAYKKFDTTDTNIIVEFFNQYIKVKEIYDLHIVYNTREIYNFCDIMIRRIIMQLYKQDKIIQILSNVEDNYCFYSNLRYHERQKLYISFIRSNVIDYEEEIDFHSSNVFLIIDYEIKHGNIKNMPFETLIRKCSLSASMIITPDVYKYMKFDDYKRRFLVIKNVIFYHYRYNFLTQDDYNKHLKYLVKTANYKHTYIQYIEKAISFIKEEYIKKQLNSIILLKQLQMK